MTDPRTAAAELLRHIDMTVYRDVAGRRLGNTVPQVEALRAALLVTTMKADIEQWSREAEREAGRQEGLAEGLERAAALATRREESGHAVEPTDHGHGYALACRDIASSIRALMEFRHD